jgi:hypothetical protein
MSFSGRSGVFLLMSLAFLPLVHALSEAEIVRSQAAVSKMTEEDVSKWLGDCTPHAKYVAHFEENNVEGGELIRLVSGDSNQLEKAGVSKPLDRDKIARSVQTDLFTKSLKEPPSPPAVTFEGATSSSVTVSVAIGRAFKSYKLMYCMGSSRKKKADAKNKGRVKLCASGEYSEWELPPNEDTITITNLDDDTDYIFRVAAFHCAGAHVESEEITVKTEMWTKARLLGFRNCWVYPQQPPAPLLTATTKASLKLKWADDTFEHSMMSLYPLNWVRHSSLQYCQDNQFVLKMARCEDYEGDGEKFRTVTHECGPSSQTCSIPKLDPGSSYRFKLKIVNKAKLGGESVYSEESDCHPTDPCLEDEDCTHGGTCKNGKCHTDGMSRQEPQRVVVGSWLQLLLFFLAAAGLYRFAIHLMHFKPVAEFTSAEDVEERPPMDNFAGSSGSGEPSKFTDAANSTHKTQFEFEVKKLLYGLAILPYFRKRCERYRAVRYVGGGAYGRVFLVQEVRTGARRTIKLLHPDGADETREVMDLQSAVTKRVPPSKSKSRGGSTKVQLATGVAALMDRRHPNLAWTEHFHRSLWQDPDAPKEKFLLMEYAELGSLDEYCGDGKKLPDEVCHRLFHDVVSGLEAMHAARRVHRDIKPANLLVNRNGVCQICDFGIIGVMNSVDDTGQPFCDDKPHQGTQRFLSPESRTGRYGPGGDLWSAGVTLLEMLTGSKVSTEFNMEYQSEGEGGAPRDVFTGLDTHVRGKVVSEDAMEMLAGILEPDEKRRWTFPQVRGCAWFQGRETCKNNVLAEALARVNQKKVSQPQ